MSASCSGLPPFWLGHSGTEREGNPASHHFSTLEGPSETPSPALTWDRDLKLPFKASGRPQGPRSFPSQFLLPGCCMLGGPCHLLHLAQSSGSMVLRNMSCFRHQRNGFPPTMHPNLGEGQGTPTLTFVGCHGHAVFEGSLIHMVFWAFSVATMDGGSYLGPAATSHFPFVLVAF